MKQLYEFGPFLLDPAERVLLRGGRQVALTPKSLDLLLVLVEQRGRLLGKKELMEAVWPDTFVEEGNLAFNISSLRKALDEDPKVPLYVETVPRRGYRFVANVRVLEGEGAAEEAAAQNPHGQGAAPSAGETSAGEGERPGPRDLAAEPKGGGGDGPAGPTAGRDASPAGESAPAAPRAGRRRGLIALAAVVLGAAGIIFGLYELAGRDRPGGRAATSFRGTQVTRLTTTRNATDAAISPDGKYVVYVVDEARRRSLWLRQVATNSHVEIIPPADVHYLDLFFSHGSDYVYYVTATADSHPALYQVPVPGGSPRKLMESMPGPIGLSPDGKQFVFARRGPGGEAELLVADAFDGGRERRLLRRGQSDFLSRPVWSPDGKVIACVAGRITPSERRAEVIEVRVADGAERALVTRGWRFVERLAWLSDGSGLLTTVSDYAYGPFQIFHVSYPGGEVQRVTNDLSNYRSVSLTSDAKTLVAVQADIRPFVWVAPGGDVGRASQITYGAGTSNDYWGFSWTPDDRIVYVSTLSGNQDIWVMNRDGNNPRQLTFDTHSDFDPAVSPDGRSVAFVSERSGGTKIWRMDIDGGNPRQLTPGETSDFLPYYSPDGRWLFYASNDGRQTRVWKIPADGGEPSAVTRQQAVWPAVSPDGTLVACWHFNERTRTVGLAVVPAGGGEPVKFFDVSPTTNTWAEIRWTPDGRALTYIDSPDRAGNIWLQPLAGGAPRRLTDFKTDRIFRYSWSRDGRHLACSRGVETNDVVLISDLR